MMMAGVSTEVPAGLLAEPEPPPMSPLESDIVEEPYRILLSTVNQALKRQRESAPDETPPKEEPPKQQGDVSGQEPETARVQAPEREEQRSPKRQKTDEANNDDSSALGTFDLGAMLQNALGSFDKQLIETPPPPAAEEPKEVTPAPSAPPERATARPPTRKRGLVIQDFNLICLTMNLPVLASLSVQILHFLSRKPRAETVALMADPESKDAKTYRSVTTAFNSVRRVFSDSSAILSPDELDIKDFEGLETVIMANKATLCVSVLHANDLPLRTVHDNFLEAFLPSEPGPMSADIAALFLSLKTHVCVAELAEQADEGARSKVMDIFFPADTADQLKQLHPDVPLTECEKSFVEQARLKKESLLTALQSEDTRKSLPERYPFNTFRDELSNYLRDNSDMPLKFAESQGIEIPRDEDEETLADAFASVDWSAIDLSTGPTKPVPIEKPSAPPMKTGEKAGVDAAGLTASLSEGLGLTELIQKSLQQKESSAQASKDLASLVAEGLVQNHGGSLVSQYTQGTNGTVPAYQTPYNPYPNQYQRTSAPGYVTTAYPPEGTISDSHELPPNQSQSSAVLYQRARQAAAAKSTAHARREGSSHSARRPWSAEEEQALMSGLDRVKGPHWSQILGLYGPNGTVNDILKDRNQVQLKDKARNLKLFFLKTNSEMPYYLTQVTGELKTRAPGQAARKEAEERARNNSEEEQARIQGIMALGNGLQNKPQTPQPTAGAGPGGVRPQQSLPAGTQVNGTAAAGTAPSATAAGIRPALPGQMTPYTAQRPLPAATNRPASMLPLAAIPRPAGAQIKMEPNTTPTIQRPQGHHQPFPQANASSLPSAQKPIQPHPVAPISTSSPAVLSPAAAALAAANAAAAAARAPLLPTPAPVYKPVTQQPQQPPARPAQQVSQQQQQQQQQLAPNTRPPISTTSQPSASLPQQQQQQKPTQQLATAQQQRPAPSPQATPILRQASVPQQTPAQPQKQQQQQLQQQKPAQMPQYRPTQPPVPTPQASPPAPSPAPAVAPPQPAPAVPVVSSPATQVAAVIAGTTLPTKAPAPAPMHAPPTIGPSDTSAPATNGTPPSTSPTQST